MTIQLAGHDGGVYSLLQVNTAVNCNGCSHNSSGHHVLQIHQGALRKYLAIHSKITQLSMVEELSLHTKILQIFQTVTSATTWQ